MEWSMRVPRITFPLTEEEYRILEEIGRNRERYASQQASYYVKKAIKAYQNRIATIEEAEPPENGSDPSTKRNVKTEPVHYEMRPKAPLVGADVQNLESGPLPRIRNRASL
jgi:hypothetical protein